MPLGSTGGIPLGVPGFINRTSDWQGTRKSYPYLSHQSITRKTMDQLSEKLARSAHYQVICDAEVSPSFRFVALFSIKDFNQVACAFAECVMMAYLGTSLQAVSFPSTELLRLVRSAFGDRFEGSDFDNIFPLPSFSKEGLNRVWSLAQGCKGISPEKSEHKRWTETNPDVCGNCRAVRPASPEDSACRGWKEDSRCWKCYIWRSRHHTERNGWLSLEDHQQWLEDTGLEDTCQNPACGVARPTEYRMKQWTGFGPNSRCHPCRQYQKKHGTDQDDDSMRTPNKHAVWVASGNADVCSECKAERPENADDWAGWMDEAKCENCRKYSQEEHEEWVLTYEDVCCGCRVPRPENWKAAGWIGFGPKSKCRKCYQLGVDSKTKQWRAGTSRNSPFVKHQKWVSEGHNDVCGNCGEARPDNWKQVGWRFFKEDSRCKECVVWKKKNGEERSVEE